ncbi:ABC-type transport auxiliary lipoprotein family protein [Labrys monachus]|uniref:Cholesterol transport system auxiliary component n=1 Tax=Labrys monachus TaxID=217067 RepID=A0ABU0FKZ0_9HYPH|nr:ABC-type transport auxiliary lipoprotein family protein [Labrys monachus]MDQ0395161.1 cholesterol transport system auxiliary component [Labrys monachus]
MRGVSVRLRPFRPGLVLLGASLLCGCSILSAPAPDTFDLTAPKHAAVKGNGRAQILIAEPTALQAIDSDRILIRPGDGKVTYLPGAQWADRLPRLVQARLIQTFENAHRTGMVGRPEDKFTPDASLVTEIRDFQIQAASGPVAVVTIAARIVSQTSGRIIAANLFTASVPAAGLSGQQASAALDQALDQVLVGVMTWTVGKV